MDPVVMRRRPNPQSVVLAAALADVLDIYDRMEDRSDPNLMLQEYIPGTVGHSWVLNGYFAAQSEWRFGLPDRRSASFPATPGRRRSGSAGRTTRSSRRRRR